MLNSWLNPFSGKLELQKTFYLQLHDEESRSENKDQTFLCPRICSLKNVFKIILQYLDYVSHETRGFDCSLNRYFTPSLDQQGKNLNWEWGRINNNLLRLRWQQQRRQQRRHQRRRHWQQQRQISHLSITTTTTATTTTTTRTRTTTTTTTKTRTTTTMTTTTTAGKKNLEEEKEVWRSSISNTAAVDGGSAD